MLRWGIRKTPRPIALKGERPIREMMSDVLKAAKRAHAKSPLEPLPREPEAEEEVCIRLVNGYGHDRSCWFEKCDRSQIHDHGHDRLNLSS